MPIDKRIYCENCKRETLHQVTKATKRVKATTEEEGDYGPECTYYDRSQCLSCGKVHSYGCFFLCEVGPPDGGEGGTVAEEF